MHLESSLTVPGFTISSSEALTLVPTVWHVYVPLFSSVGLLIRKVWLNLPNTLNLSEFTDRFLPL